MSKAAVPTPAQPSTTLPTAYDASLYEQDAGSGFENADRDSFAIPFLIILQSQSPQCKRSDGAYVPGAEEGKLFNTVTGKVYDGERGVDVIPCYYRPSWLRWAPRDGGGGFKGEMPADDPAIVRAKRSGAVGAIELDNGDQIHDTRVHYVLLLDPDDPDAVPQPAVISLTSTQIKKSKQWMSKMEGIKLKGADGHMFTAPMFSHVYHLTTVPEKNDQGSWYGWKIELARMQSDRALFEAARLFKQQVAKGEVKEQPATLHPEAGDPEF